MHRREFIKLSSLTAAWFATDNAFSRALAAAPPTNGTNIMIYKIIHRTYGLQVCATKYLNVKEEYSGFGTKGRIDINKFDISTFEPIEIVSLEQANDRKKYWWDKLECQGRWVKYQGLDHSKTGKLGANKLKQENFYISNEFKEIKKKVAKAGGQRTKEKYENDPEYAEMVRTMHKKVKPETWERHKENITKWGKKVSQTPEHRERCRKMGKIWGGKNGHILKDIPTERKKEICSKGGKGGGAAKQIAQGNHNFLTNSPNKTKVMCPDGHITIITVAKVYCERRGLNYQDCVRLTPQQVDLVTDLKL